MSPPKFNPVEPPWYGPVCPVVWEGRHREVPPYPDQKWFCDRIAAELTATGAQRDGLTAAQPLGKPFP
jgi:hypothetical protein